MGIYSLEFLASAAVEAVESEVRISEFLVSQFFLEVELVFFRLPAGEEAWI